MNETTKTPTASFIRSPMEKERKGTNIWWISSINPYEAEIMTATISIPFVSFPKLRNAKIISK